MFKFIGIVVTLLTLCFPLYVATEELPSQLESDAYLSIHVAEWTPCEMHRLYNRSSDLEPESDLTKKLEKYTHKYMDYAKKHFDITYPIRLKISHSIKNERVLGFAYGLYDGPDYMTVIAYNHDQLLGRPDHDLEEAAAHEVAHLIGYYRGEINVHNDVWKKYCKTLMPTATCEPTL